MDLAAALPVLLPRAIRWAEREAERGISRGTRLAPAEIALAVKVGVWRPERIRVVGVEALPEPDDFALRAAAFGVGLLGGEAIGLTLGYAVFIRRGSESRSTLAHELRHVAQYESAGGIAAFLPVYLVQIIEFGYAGAPLEADAREHEWRSESEAGGGVSNH